MPLRLPVASDCPGEIDPSAAFANQRIFSKDGCVVRFALNAPVPAKLIGVGPVELGSADQP